MAQNNPDIWKSVLVKTGIYQSDFDYIGEQKHNNNCSKSSDRLVHRNFMHIRQEPDYIFENFADSIKFFFKGL